MGCKCFADEWECLQTLEEHSREVDSVARSQGSGILSASWNGTVTIWQDVRVKERRREMKYMMLSLRRANRRRRDREGNPLPSKAGREVYNPDLGRKIGEFL